MEQRKIIAVDIDDVLSAHAEAWVAFSNEQWGTSMQAKDYHEDWGALWRVDDAEAKHRSSIFHKSGIHSRLKHYSEAVSVLQKLAQDFQCVIVTSRQTVVSLETHEWLARFFPDIFSDVYFAGFYDVTHHNTHLTKAELAADIGAQYLIDDHPKHCTAAAVRGIETVLFGNYAWNQVEELPPGITRCQNWQAIEEYFDVRS